MNKKTTRLDVFILAIFSVLITLHPFFLHGKMNVFELGIYLPNIQAILDGRIPHRDFFHLRGAFELYPPALLMRLFGENVAVLEAYFYFGTVLTLIFCVMTARKLYQTRLILYLMVPVLVARTFPRVVFTYWGGMRFALGILAVMLAVECFQRRKNIWIFWTGVVTGGAFFTSIEIGISALAGILGAIFLSLWLRSDERKKVYIMGIVYLLGFFVVVLSFGFYLVSQGALMAYLDSVWTVVSNMQNVFNMRFLSDIPASFSEVLLATINPAHKNFKHMTPVYLYLFLGGFLIHRYKGGGKGKIDPGLLAVGIYGLIMYVSAFRNIEASQFEMALQPEKILLFYLLERVYVSLKEKKVGLLGHQGRGISQPKISPGSWRKIWGINVLFGLLILFSLGYAVQRYNHRFFAFKYIRNKILGKETVSLIPSYGAPFTGLETARGKGLVIPSEQAEDFQQVIEFVRSRTKPDEKILFFPELGTYYFLFDRPFVGRFPMVTFSWLDDQWHEEFFSDLNSVSPQFVITDQQLDPKYEKAYFKVSGNKDKYDQVALYIQEHYQPVRVTPSLRIYERKR